MVTEFHPQRTDDFKQRFQETTELLAQTEFGFPPDRVVIQAWLHLAETTRQPNPVPDTFLDEACRWLYRSIAEGSPVTPPAAPIETNE